MLQSRRRRLAMAEISKRDIRKLILVHAMIGIVIAIAILRVGRQIEDASKVRHGISRCAWFIYEDGLHKQTLYELVPFDENCPEKPSDTVEMRFNP